MNSWLRLGLLGGVLTATWGCGLNGPNWRHPGSVPYQQSRANYYDPYADNDAAPAVPGARPRDFQSPRAEPVRSSAFRDAFGAF